MPNNRFVSDKLRTALRAFHFAPQPGRYTSNSLVAVSAARADFNKLLYQDSI
jgi:hypothetical protein